MLIVETSLVSSYYVVDIVDLPEQALGEAYTAHLDQPLRHGPHDQSRARCSALGWPSPLTLRTCFVMSCVCGSCRFSTDKLLLRVGWLRVFYGLSMGSCMCI